MREPWAAICLRVTAEAAAADVGRVVAFAMALTPRLLATMRQRHSIRASTIVARISCARLLYPCPAGRMYHKTIVS
jgi:hypothetical protein